MCLFLGSFAGVLGLGLGFRVFGFSGCLGEGAFVGLCRGRRIVLPEPGS